MQFLVWFYNTYCTIVEVLGLYLNTGFGLSGKPSGTTATIVVVDGWTVTVACVGDSRCILDSQGVVTNLTVDHRLDTNQEE